MRLLLLLAALGLCQAAHHLGDHAVARFDMNGVRGLVEFDFLNGALTVESNLTGLNGNVSFEVRSLPFFPGQSKQPCTKTGVLFNPTSAAPAAALGKLSQRVGMFSNWYKAARDTSGLSVLGTNGTSGRSLVLLQGATTIACANIRTAGQPDMPQCGSKGMMNKHETLKATFRGRVSGTLFLRRLKGSSSNHSTFYHNLYYTDDSVATNGHVFHVHAMGIGRKTWPCNSTLIGGVVQDLGNTLSIGSSPTDASATRVEDVDDTMSFSDLANKAVAIHDKTNHHLMIACADFEWLQPRRFVADLGNNLNVAVEQGSPLDATDVSTNAGDDVMSVSVRKYPVKDAGSCGDNTLGSEFNPFNKQKSSGNMDMTGDKLPTGDLTDKLRGGMQLGKRQVCDENMPLFGSNSVGGRSVVVKYRNGAVRCGTLMQMAAGGTWLRAKATFREAQGGSVAGTVYLKQYKYADGSVGQTTIDTDGLQNSAGTTVNHNYHVHIGRKGYQRDVTACNGSYAMGHYNPSSVTYSGLSTSKYQTGCGPDSQLRCELGDTSKKSGKMNLTNSRALRQDSWLPLDGPYSVLGRSFVIHAADGGAPRYACANIIPMTAQDVQIGFKKSKLQGSNFDKADFEKQVMATVPSGLSISLSYTSSMEDPSSGCVYASAAIDGSGADAVASNLATSFLGPYSQDNNCIKFAQGGGSGAVSVSASLALLFASLLAFYLA